jgi:hypothetical protein
MTFLQTFAAITLGEGIGIILTSVAIVMLAAVIRVARKK